MPDFDRVFWAKIWQATQRIIGALILIGLHRLLDWVLSSVVGQWVWLEPFVSGILLTAFLIIYFVLLLDTILIFVPKRRPRRKGGRRVARRTES